MAALRPIEQIASVAIAVTPITLALDYRAGVSVWSVSHTYPLLYYGSYTDPGKLGLTPLVWIAAGAIALVKPSTRRGFASVSTISLVALTLVILAATAAHESVDAYTVYALLASLLPLTAMTAILTNNGLRREVLTRLIAFVLVVAALGIAVTFARDAYGTLRHVAPGAGHTLSDRFDVFLFGPNGPPATGAALAGLTMLIPAAAVRRRYQVVLAICLVAATLLTQTRGAVLAAGVGILVFALVSGIARRALIGAALGALLIFALVSHRSVTAVGDQSNIIRRTQVVKHVDFFRHRPVFGSGLAARTANEVTGAHNAVLSVAVAGGVVAAVLWLLAWCYPVVRGLAGSRHSVLAGSAAATLAAFCVGWTTTGNEIFVTTPPTNFLPLVFAAAMGTLVSRPKSEPARSRGRVFALAFIIGIAAVVVVPTAVARGLGIPSSWGPSRHVVELNGGNAVPNPGAETGVGDWSTLSTADGLAPLLIRTTDPSVVSSGTWAFLVYSTNVSSGPRDEAAYTASAVRLRPGRIYRLSASVSGKATNAHPLLLGLRMPDGSLSQVPLTGGGRGATKTGPGNNTRLAAEIKPTRALGPVQVAIWEKALPADANGQFAFDDVRLCEADTPGC